MRFLKKFFERQRVSDASAVPAVFVIIFLFMLVVVNIFADLAFSNAILERIYEVNSLIIKDKKLEQNLLEIGSRISANTLMLKIINLIMLFSTIGAIIVFIRILRTHQVTLVSRLSGAILLTFLVYFLHSANIIWGTFKIPSIEGHFVQLGLDKPIEAISIYCKLSFDIPLQIDNLIEQGKVSAELVKPNPYCPEGLLTIRVLFYLNMLMGIMLVALAMGIGAVNLRNLEKFSSRAIYEWRAGKTDRVIDLNMMTEYRKRINDIKTVLYVGTIVLIIAIIWMSAQTRWAFPILLTSKNLESLSIINGYIAYVAMLYFLIIGGSFLPQAIIVRIKLRNYYYKKIYNPENREAPALSFDRWVEKEELNSLFELKDIVAILAPLATLLLTGALDVSSLKDFAGIAVK